MTEAAGCARRSRIPVPACTEIAWLCVAMDGMAEGVAACTGCVAMFAGLGTVRGRVSALMGPDSRMAATMPTTYLIDTILAADSCAGRSALCYACMQREV